MKPQSLFALALLGILTAMERRLWAVRICAALTLGVTVELAHVASGAWDVPAPPVRAAWRAPAFPYRHNLPEGGEEYAKSDLSEMVQVVPGQLHHLHKFGESGHYQTCDCSVVVTETGVIQK